METASKSVIMSMGMQKGARENNYQRGRGDVWERWVFSHLKLWWWFNKCTHMTKFIKLLLYNMQHIICHLYFRKTPLKESSLQRKKATLEGIKTKDFLREGEHCSSVLCRPLPALKRDSCHWPALGKPLLHACFLRKWANQCCICGFLSPLL